jgi:hypothetical protein
MTIHQSLRKGLLVKGVMMCLGKRSFSGWMGHTKNGGFWDSSFRLLAQTPARLRSVWLYPTESFPFARRRFPAVVRGGWIGLLNRQAGAWWLREGKMRNERATWRYDNDSLLCAAAHNSESLSYLIPANESIEKADIALTRLETWLTPGSRIWQMLATPEPLPEPSQWPDSRRR